MPKNELTLFTLALEAGLVPAAEEVEPWVETILRLWDDADFYEAESRRCLAAAEAWRPERLLPRFEALFRKVKRAGKPRPYGDLQAKTPQPAGAMFQDAVLHMTFEKDTFYEKEGKTYVRDLSGNGYDGLCEGVAYTPEGKAGGALKFDGKGWMQIPHPLLNHQANYTVIAWVRLRKNAPDGELFREGDSQRDKKFICSAALLSGGRIGSAAWNRSATDPTTGNWFNREKAGVFPYEKWVFLTIALENGGAKTGSLRVTVDDKEYHLPSQMVDSSTEDTSVTLGKHLEGKLGEVAVFHRFLFAGEIEAIRQRGSDKAQPP
ncbi:MAG TPA: hypothetical protein DDY78_16960 [Planctomycetales bacterium]|nr:hypothetical protein [Planctomycetales bacterium]